MKLLVLAHAEVGERLVGWLLEHYRDDLGRVVTVGDDAIAQAARQAGVSTGTFTTAADLAEQLAAENLRPDLGLLIWWPKIVKCDTLGLAREGFLNTHPSYLPYNRGKHYSFWSLIEQCPFGVSLHFVDEGVDSGDIVAQKRIDYDWSDTGGTLCLRAREAIVELFQQTYPRLRTGDIPRRPQDLAEGSYHHSSEIEPACELDLDATCTVRELLNLLRARTFPGHPACRFTDGGQNWEVRVDIRKCP